MNDDYGRQAVIDCKIIDSNLKAIRNSIPSTTGIIAVVKGDAYGHGLDQMGEYLSKSEEIRMIAVASLEEAMAIYANGKEVLIMYPVYSQYLKKLMSVGNYSDEQLGYLFQKVVFTISNLQEFMVYTNLAKILKKRIRVHVRLDFQSGVRGLSKDCFEDNYRDIFSSEVLEVCGIYGHAYSAYYQDDDAIVREYSEYAEAFNMVKKEISSDIMCHLLTSMSYLKFPEFAFDAIRLGAALYGLPVDDNPKQRTKQIMTISANVFNVVEIDENAELDYVSKNSESVRKVALVTLGEWDIPNLFRGSKCTVMINGKLTSVVGAPCMDTCCIDITDIEDVKVGNEAFFLADFEGISINDKIIENGYTLSDCQNLFMGIGRVPKIYK